MGGAVLWPQGQGPPHLHRGSARFEFSSEPGATFKCSLDGAPFATCVTPKVYAGLSNGNHTLQAKAPDRAGNAGPIVSRTWTVAPEATGQQTVEANGTLSTDAEDDGTTVSDPLETSVTSPVGGTVSVTETPVLDPATVGYSFLGQQANIEAPASTPENPLRFVFSIDTSPIPAGDDEDTVEVFRNGVRVERCAEASGIASPDPCVLQRITLEGGDVEFTVLTSHASYWNFGVADREAPAVESVAPPNLARNVSARANVTATFSEAMQVSTVNKGTFVLVKKGTPTYLGAKVTYSAATDKATLNPTRDLKPGATYVVTLKGGSGGVQDVSGNALTQNRVWSFTIKK